jgi:hypothetical protein
LCVGFAGQVQITTNGVFIFAALRPPAPKVLLLPINLKLSQLIGYFLAPKAPFLRAFAA